MSPTDLWIIAMCANPLTVWMLGTVIVVGNGIVIIGGVQMAIGLAAAQVLVNSGLI